MPSGSGEWRGRGVGSRETVRGDNLLRISPSSVRQGEWLVERYDSERGRFFPWAPHPFQSQEAARRWVDDRYPPEVPSPAPEAWGFSRRRSRQDRRLGRR